jgi:hypothetical protein
MEVQWIQFTIVKILTCDTPPTHYEKNVQCLYNIQWKYTKTCYGSNHKVQYQQFKLTMDMILNQFH